MHARARKKRLVTVRSPYKAAILIRQPAYTPAFTILSYRPASGKWRQYPVRMIAIGSPAFESFHTEPVRCYAAHTAITPATLRTLLRTYQKKLAFVVRR